MREPSKGEAPQLHTAYRVFLADIFAMLNDMETHERGLVYMRVKMEIAHRRLLEDQYDLEEIKILGREA